MKNQANTKPSRPGPVFFLPALEPGMNAAEISGEEASHILRARRLRAGDGIVLTNGRGLMADGEIISARTRPDTVEVSLQPPVAHTPTSPALILATALPKGERLSTMLDMATQLGMDKIVPLQCEHSVVSYRPKMQGRWMRIIANACKQSRRAWLPGIGQAVSPIQLVNEAPPASMILYGDHNAPVQGIPDNLSPPPREIVLMIGPEAGFSQQETHHLQHASSARAVGIGRHILRTETAAVAMLSHASRIRSRITDTPNP